MAKICYVIEYKVKDKKSGKYTKGGTMTDKREVQADGETNAIGELKKSLAFKLAADTQEWEIVKVTPKK